MKSQFRYRCLKNNQRKQMWALIIMLLHTITITNTNAFLNRIVRKSSTAQLNVRIWMFAVQMSLLKWNHNHQSHWDIRDTKVLTSIVAYLKNLPTLTLIETQPRTLFQKHFHCHPLQLTVVGYQLMEEFKIFTNQILIYLVQESHLRILITKLVVFSLRQTSLFPASMKLRVPQANLSIDVGKFHKNSINGIWMSNSQMIKINQQLFLTIS